MTAQLSPEEIKYICEWAQAGNEPRVRIEPPREVSFHCCSLTPPPGHRRLTLSSAGLTIAAQADEIARLKAALVQANETAEECQRNRRESRLNVAELHTEIDQLRAEVRRRSKSSD